MGAAVEKITINFGNESMMRRVRTVLKYESEIRGLSIGQTSSEMILEAVDLDEYPEEVKQRLREIQEQAREKAVEKSLKMSRDSLE